MSLLATLGGVLGGVFMRKVSTIGPDGKPQEQRRVRRPIKGLMWVLAFLMLWHFIAWPVLNYFFPQVGFPALDARLLGSLLTLGL